ncbi:SRPBCC family protein [Gudongella sp. SC589]|uniref:SRPBCC family protein n=1 Tax=Gudongella sp. SC589 TaxID=3385990 RepID=UPI0039049204
MEKQKIVVQATVNQTVDKIWEYLNLPEHITKWNSASEDWHTPRAVNDLRVGGQFNYRMEAKDGSYGFDFSGKYHEVELNRRIAYTLDDGRKVLIELEPVEAGVNVKYTFEAEESNSMEMQRSGWQAILDNFKKYSEMQ